MVAKVPRSACGKHFQLATVTDAHNSKIKCGRQSSQNVVLRGANSPDVPVCPLEQERSLRRINILLKGVENRLNYPTGRGEKGN